MKQIWCPGGCGDMDEDKPCIHYQKYGWKPGENQDFFIKLISQNYVPGSSMGWKGKRKSIGTSAGNTRTKNTRCTFPGCNKDLNGVSFQKQQAHAEEHKKDQPQTRLFQ